MNGFLRFLGNLFSPTVLIYEMLPRTILTSLLVFATFNMSGWSWYHWMWEFDYNDRVWLIIRLIVTLFGIGAWVYLLMKMWQGAGKNIFVFIIPAAILGLVLWLFVELSLLKPFSVWFIFWLEVEVGVFMGFWFSAIIMDRRYSGVVTTAETTPEAPLRDDATQAGGVQR